MAGKPPNLQAVFHILFIVLIVRIAMKVRFIIDEDYDLATAKSMNFTKEQLGYAKKLYQICPEEIEISKKSYQKSWDKINDKFSNYVKEKTGYDWFYPKYECVVSTSVQGASNWGEAPKIVRAMNQEEMQMRRIVAHEIILSHFFEIYKRNYQKGGLTDDQVWALAEIAAFILTSTSDKTKEVENFWKSVCGWPPEFGYEHITNLCEDLKKVYLKKGDFQEFIKEGIRMVKKYPNMNPSGLSE